MTAMAAGLLLGVLAPAGPAAGVQPQASASLGVGDRAFWDGEHVASFHGGATAFTYFAERRARPADSTLLDPCEVGGARCWRYDLHVTEAGGQLRVGLDASSRADCFALELTDPAGASRGFLYTCPGVSEALSAHSFTHEITVPNAPTGRWEARVILADATDWAFRVRATLQGPVEEAEVLAPNLRTWLPSEFGFAAPANPASGRAGDNENALSTPGISCTHGEIVDEGASHCLRFSTGLHNVGDGPLHVMFGSDDRATQRVYLRDGTPGEFPNGAWRDRPAGTAEYHDEHAHRHYSSMVLYELFAVTKPGGAGRHDARHLRQLGTGAKTGYCTVDQQLGRWRRFDADPKSSVDIANCNDGLGLGKGWGDIYRWQRPGQYVPFDQALDADGTMRAGLYLVRVTVDPDNLLVETREDDNDGYALIRVVDGDAPATDRVVICERGFGPSPWDRRTEKHEEPFWWDKLASSQAARGGECGEADKSLDRPRDRRPGRCLARRSPIGPRNIGRIRLGYSRRRLRRLPVKPIRRTRHSYRYCVKGGRGRVAAIFSRRGRVVLITTTARSYGHRAVRPGSRVRAVRRSYPRRRSFGQGLYRTYPRGPRLIGVRGGRVRFIAVADRRLLRDPRTLRRYLARADGGGR